MERCTNCGHRWIDYEGTRAECYLCGSNNISECLSLREVRDAIQALRNNDKKYLDKHTKRSVILKQRYREIAELSLERANEVYNKAKDHYLKGNLSDKVVDQLIVAFRLFSELGVNKPAAVTAYMTAMGYAQRGIEKEIRQVDDLSDLVAARQWFMRLGSKEWEAVINLRIGEKAMATINSDPQALQSTMQVALWHFYKAREYYFEMRNTHMIDRIQFDIERTTQLLISYTQELSQIEAAKISAQSTISYGEHVRKGLESMAKSLHYGLSTLGDQIEHHGGSLSRTKQAASLGAYTAKTASSVASSANYRGHSLDTRLPEIGQLLTKTAKEIPDDFYQQLKDLSTKFALSPGGNAPNATITNDPSIRSISESISPDVKKSQESLKHLDEPSIKLTGTLLDTLVSKGFGKVLEQLQDAESTKKNPQA